MSYRGGLKFNAVKIPRLLGKRFKAETDPRSILNDKDFFISRSKALQIRLRITPP